MARRVDDLAVTVRPAQPADVAAIDEMLLEASRWVDALGTVMWEAGELAPGRVAETSNRRLSGYQ